jgi:phosphatidylglycerophosphate synthase
MHKTIAPKEKIPGQRRLEEPSEFGGILDMFCDRIVEVSLIIAIISTDPSNLLWPGIFSLGAIVLCITMFLVVGGSIKAEALKETQKVIYYRKGLMERSETFMFLLLITLFIWLRWILLWLFAALVFLTALLRLYDAYKIFVKLEKNERIIKNN